AKLVFPEREVRGAIRRAMFAHEVIDYSTNTTYLAPCKRLCIVRALFKQQKQFRYTIRRALVDLKLFITCS
ncbi:hypothetical protein, partial [Klebsiella pneumoniae]|uniref:hypothetical protein n=1 Tax=Klebsiella pneumoniae TaxID=573 RepID=UPI002730620B